MGWLAMIRKGYASVSAGQIHYYERQGSGCPILFLHQTASSGRSFNDLMCHLDLSNRLIAFDTPGFGGSFNPPEGYDIGQLATWIADATENMGIRGAHLVGHHTGASIAGELALNYNWVRSVAMIGPPAFSEEDSDTLPKTFSKTFEVCHDGSHLLDTWQYLGSVGASKSLDLQHREFLDTSRAFRSRAQVFGAVCRHDFRAVLRRIRQPLALLCAHDDVLFAAWSAAISQRPDAFSRILSGGNFEPDLDTLGCANALKDFWCDIEGHDRLQPHCWTSTDRHRETANKGEVC